MNTETETKESSFEAICVDAFSKVFDGPPVLEPVEEQWYARIDSACLETIAKESGIEVVQYDDSHDSDAVDKMLEVNVSAQVLGDNDNAAKTVLGMIFSRGKADGLKIITSKVMLKIHPSSRTKTCLVLIRIQCVR